MPNLDPRRVNCRSYDGIFGSYSGWLQQPDADIPGNEGQQRQSRLLYWYQLLPV